MAPTGITVVTGFLGAGKTTLVNYVLNADHGYRGMSCMSCGVSSRPKHLFIFFSEIAVAHVPTKKHKQLCLDELPRYACTDVNVTPLPPSTPCSSRRCDRVFLIVQWP